MTIKIKTKKLSYKLASKLVELSNTAEVNLYLHTTKKVVAKLKNNENFKSLAARIYKIKIIKKG